ncbi:hypothetical protein N0O92_08655 [Alkalihalobacillus sp. MEB130]|uniref:hypothetical protein n=1 Tax=Alkalihalobacillus sp. MEB130 TaxID=2976704 RepID=UPI0028DF7D01|nr:hypothetical protein [Alkalihalobacillus sp. MEB130]MDT8860302.1 hypothetical protein [Alkalihalobacillus sp. MEB130]
MGWEGINILVWIDWHRDFALLPEESVVVEEELEEVGTKSSIAETSFSYKD